MEYYNIILLLFTFTEVFIILPIKKLYIQEEIL